MIFPFPSPPHVSLRLSLLPQCICARANYQDMPFHYCHKAKKREREGNKLIEELFSLPSGLLTVAWQTRDTQDTTFSLHFTWTNHVAPLRRPSSQTKLPPHNLNHWHFSFQLQDKCVRSFKADQCIQACRHGQEVVNTSSERGRKMINWNGIGCWLPDELICVFQKLLMFWDFLVQLSVGFTENCLENYPAAVLWVKVP